MTVFTNRIEPGREEDVQWVFINELSVRDGTLLVTSERGKTYQIDLKTKMITQSGPRSPTPDATAHLHDIPEAINRAITNGFLAKEYEVSFHLNPFYLPGDFNGDGKTDRAVLGEQRSTGKLGIAIIDGATDKVPGLSEQETPLAMAVMTSGGWIRGGFIPKAAPPRKLKEVPRHLRGDAFLVSKSEAASALIYWNGRALRLVSKG